MEVITYTAARNNLAKTIDKVNADHAPVVITRQNGPAAVLLSLDDFNSLEETAYLLRSPKMASRLRAALESWQAGDGQARQLVDPET